MIKMMRKYFVTGLLIWVPALITIFFLRLFFSMGDRFLLLLPESLHVSSYVGINIPGYGILLLLSSVLVTGVLAKNIFGKIIVQCSEALLSRVPLVRSIYYGVKRSLQVFFTTNKAFHEVVLVEYPRKGSWSVAFVTDRSPSQTLFDEDMVMLFVPTTPNPTSGYILIVPYKDVRVLDMSIDDAIQFIISLGTACALKDRVVTKKM